MITLTAITEGKGSCAATCAGLLFMLYIFAVYSQVNKKVKNKYMYSSTLQKPKLSV